MSLINGTGYKKRLDQQKTSIIYNGEKVNEPISAHPVFKGLIETQSRWYDLQCEKKNQDTLTYYDSGLKERCGISFLTPKTTDDLERKRLGYQKLAEITHGLLGRSPEYLNTALMIFNEASPLFYNSTKGTTKDTLKEYVEHVKQHDLCLTHTFIQPQVNRASYYMESDKEVIAARIIDQKEDGLILHGARLLATQGPTTNDLMIFPSGAELPSYLENQGMAYAFSIPNDTKGMTYYCRESYAGSHNETFNYPLSSNLEEMDTMVVFDHVTIPWDRVFFYNDIIINNSIYSESGFFPHVTHQVMCKNIIKLNFILDLAQQLVDELNVSEYQHIQAKIADIMVALETVKGFIHTSEKDASINRWGVMTPAENPLLAATIYFPETYPVLIDILKKIGASGLVNLPMEKDFLSEHGPVLDHYLQSSKSKGTERVKLFRKAWDLTMSAYGNRQTQYEQFFFGDPVRLKSQIYRQYKKGL